MNDSEMASQSILKRLGEETEGKCSEMCLEDKIALNALNEELEYILEKTYHRPLDTPADSE